MLMPDLRIIGRLFTGRANDPDQWKRNQLALSAAVFSWFAGSGFVTPFLALYIQQLGEFSTEETVLWSGAIFAAGPLVSAAIGPLWGALGDRVGLKMMLERSLLGITIGFALMAVVTSPWQLLAVRAAIGIFGGFVVAALAIVSVANPPDRVSEGIGLIQAARVLGMAIGPLIGGFLADAVGIRNSFFATVALGLVALALVAFLVKEPASPAGKRSTSHGSGVPVWAMLTAPAFIGALTAIAVTRLTEGTFDPVLPLLVGQLGPSSLGLATTTGIIASGGFVATSVSAAMVGPLTRKVSGQRVLVFALIGGVLAFLPLALVQTWWDLLILRAVVGLVLGAAITLGYSAGAEATTAERRGLSMGVLGAAGSYGASSGYLIAGVAGIVDLKLVFVVNAALFLAASGICVLTFRRRTDQL